MHRGMLRVPLGRIFKYESRPAPMPTEIKSALSKAPAKHQGYNSPNKNVNPEGVTDKVGFKQWSRPCRLVSWGKGRDVQDAREMGKDTGDEHTTNRQRAGLRAATS